MAGPRRVRPPNAAVFAVSGPRPPEEDPAQVVARRLRLPPLGPVGAKGGADRWSRPWRYWLLRYLAALAEVADYERTVFNVQEARAALDALIEDAREVSAMLGRRPR